MTKIAKRQQLSQDRQIRRLRPEAIVYEHAIAGTQGLRIRVHPNGRKDWFYRYRHRQTGKLQRMKLGEYCTGGMSLAAARIEVNRWRQVVREHGSAKEYRERERETRRAKLAAKEDAKKHAAFTVEVMIERYLDAASVTLKSWRNIARSLRKYVVSEIGHMPAGDV
ncbi:MAG: Arm DNA-binding domain-containing protein, partial [Proteobacteria bacterium]|nr:Arm DNA-binding domain-containing protein [Pseudomonadota bacterium]